MPSPLQDILSVIAYGTPSVQQKALNLLLHYWPLPLPEFTHHASSTYGGMFHTVLSLPISVCLCSDDDDMGDKVNIPA